MSKNGTACVKRLKLSESGGVACHRCDGRYDLRSSAGGAGGISKLAPPFEIHVAHSPPVSLIGAYQKLWDRMLSTRGERGMLPCAQNAPIGLEECA